MKKFFIILSMVGFIVTSCATNPKLDPNYQAYLKVQQQMAQNQPKIVEIDAQPGQSIVLQGISKFVVYNANSGSRTQIAIHRTQPNPATIIFSKIFDTALDASKSILPTYFGWHYGSHILSKAFDRAGGNYNVNGDYNTGQMTKVTGDYTTGTKYQVQGNYAGADQVQGDKVGANKYQAGQDYTGGNKATTGGDYVGQDKTDTTTTTTTTTTSTTTATNSDNSTLTIPKE